MKYLLDTEVWLWSLSEPDRLNSRAKKLLADGTQEIYLSAASSWEIAIKYALGSCLFPNLPTAT